MTGTRGGRWPPRRGAGDPEPRQEWPPGVEWPGAIGDISESLKYLVRTSVLGEASYQLDAAGTAAEQYRAPFACLAVTSSAPGQLIIAAGPRGPAAPGPGPGTGIVPPRGFAVINMKGYAWSLYGGNQGDLVTVQAFTRPQPPIAVAGPLAPAVLTEVVPGNPAAGATYSLLNNTTLPWTILSVKFTFTADAVVANRFTSVQWLDGSGAVVTQNFDAQAVVASTALTSFYAAGVPNIANAASGTLLGALPAVPLQPGWTLKINVSGIDVGDQLSAIVVAYTTPAT